MWQREHVLNRLQGSVDQLSAEATAAIKIEVPGFRALWSDRIESEVFGFSQVGIAQSIDVMRRRTMPMPAELEFVRQRAAQRARQMVPISAPIHGFLIANRVVVRALRGIRASHRRWIPGGSRPGRGTRRASRRAAARALLRSPWAGRSRLRPARQAAS